MSYRTAVHYAHVVLSLHSKASKYARDLFDPPDVSLFAVFIESFWLFRPLLLLIIPPIVSFRMKSNPFV